MAHVRIAAAATEAWWESINAETALSYEEIAGKGVQNVRKASPPPVSAPLPSLHPSIRASCRLLWAVSSILSNIFRPYILFLAPAWACYSCIDARARRHFFTCEDSSSSARLHLLWCGVWYGILFVSELRHRFLRGSSPRTDGAMGSGAHRVVAEVGWSFDPRNGLLERLQAALAEAGDYEEKATPWLWGCTGDLATLFPFVAHGFFLPRHRYERRWVRVVEDSSRAHKPKEATAAAIEAVAMDVLLPDAGIDPSKPVIVLLAGLTGGSEEGYIRDIVQEAVQVRGQAVVVMLARGTNGCPCHSGALFHGARTSDFATVCALVSRAATAAATAAAAAAAAAAATTTAAAAASTTTTTTTTTSTRARIYGVGVSMGGIILPNYLCKSGSSAALDGAVVLSGSLRTLVTMHFWHSRYLWQPLLVRGLVDSFCRPFLSALAHRGCDLHAVRDCCDLVDFDARMVATYHQYRDLPDYYDDMSAASSDDRLPAHPEVSSSSCSSGHDPEDRLSNIKKPCFILHAKDDPIIHADSIPTARVTRKSAHREPSNILLLMTKHGGHIGWPTGWLPCLTRFSFSTNLALDFIDGLHAELAAPLVPDAVQQ